MVYLEYMNKTQAESISRTAQVNAMMQMVDSLRRQSDPETARKLDQIITAGLDAYHNTKAGL